MNAIEYFQSNNCSQAVLMSLSHIAGLDINQARALGSGFGGGMKHKETCGAITGACMAISHSVFISYEDADDGKEIAGQAVEEFMNLFKDKFSHFRCIDLLNTDSEEEGRRERVCEPLVEYASQIAKEVISKYKK